MNCTKIFCLSFLLFSSGVSFASGGGGNTPQPKASPSDSSPGSFLAGALLGTLLTPTLHSSPASPGWFAEMQQAMQAAMNNAVPTHPVDPRFFGLHPLTTPDTPQAPPTPQLGLGVAQFPQGDFLVSPIFPAAAPDGGQSSTVLSQANLNWLASGASPLEPFALPASPQHAFAQPDVLHDLPIPLLAAAAGSPVSPHTALMDAAWAADIELSPQAVAFSAAVNNSVARNFRRSPLETRAAQEESRNNNPRRGSQPRRLSVAIEIEEARAAKEAEEARALSASSASARSASAAEPARRSPAKRPASTNTDGGDKTR